MDVMERVQKSIDYIEDHLMTEIALEDVARIACYSAYHFHRLFQMTVGVPVMTYIKSRRLDYAATELVQSDRKIMDIALDSGFGGHETFTRAFKRTFQMTPAQYRKAGQHVSFFARVDVWSAMTTHIGGIQVTPTIIEKPEIKILGYLIQTSNVDNRGMREIPAFWQRYIKEGLGHKIPNKLNENVELGVCVDHDLKTGGYGYLIGFEVEDATGIENGELTLRTIPAATYAVFTTPPATNETFADNIQGTWGAIFQDWFPTSGYEMAGTPDFEWYDERCYGDDNKVIDIYIPIKPRASVNE